jgi:hypothetical protein
MVLVVGDAWIGEVDLGWISEISGGCDGRANMRANRSS